MWEREEARLPCSRPWSHTSSQAWDEILPSSPGCVSYSIEIMRAAVQVISTRSPTLTFESAFLSTTREL